MWPDGTKRFGIEVTVYSWDSSGVHDTWREYYSTHTTIVHMFINVFLYTYSKYLLFWTSDLDSKKVQVLKLFHPYCFFFRFNNVVSMASKDTQMN